MARRPFENRKLAAYGLEWTQIGKSRRRLVRLPRPPSAIQRLWPLNHYKYDDPEMTSLIAVLFAFIRIHSRPTSVGLVDRYRGRTPHGAAL